MRIAFLVALRGTCPRASVGSLIVQDKRIVSMGYNGAAPGEEHCTDAGCDLGYACDEEFFNTGLGTHWETGCKRAVHAEANAIAFAAKAGVPTEGATLFSTHSPCPDCARLVAGAGIITVVYQHEYRDHEGLRLLGRLGIQAHQYQSVV